jgi:hypothetical protein
MEHYQILKPLLLFHLLNIAVLDGKSYSVTNQYLKKLSYGFWDNQWLFVCLFSRGPQGPRGWLYPLASHTFPAGS